MYVGDVHASVLETDEQENLSATAKTDDEKSTFYTFESYPCVFFKDYFDWKNLPCLHAASHQRFHACYLAEHPALKILHHVNYLLWSKKQWCGQWHVGQYSAILTFWVQCTAHQHKIFVTLPWGIVMSSILNWLGLFRPLLLPATKEKFTRLVHVLSQRFHKPELISLKLY